MGRVVTVLIFCAVDACIIAFGCGMIYVGYLAKTGQPLVKQEDVNDKIAPISTTIMVFGGAVICVGILGLVSVILNHHLLIMIFELSLILTSGTLFLTGACTLSLVGIRYTWLREEMIQIMMDKKPRDKMDEIESKHKCCGVSGEMNLYDSKPFYPSSCCLVFTTGTKCKGIHTYRVRCDEIWTNDRDPKLWVLGFFFIAISVLSALMAFFIHKAEKREYKKKLARQSEVEPAKPIQPVKPIQPEKQAQPEKQVKPEPRQSSRFGSQAAIKASYAA